MRVLLEKLALLFFGLRDSLFDEHHRDAFHDRIAHLAARADEPVRLCELDVRVALGAGEDLEQLMGDHAGMLQRRLAAAHGDVLVPKRSHRGRGAVVLAPKGAESHRLD